MKYFLVLMLLWSSVLSGNTAIESQNSKLLTDWIRLQLTLIRSNKGVAHVAYSRHFSYTSIAFYESINADEKNYSTLSEQLEGYAKKESVPKQFYSTASGNAAYAVMLRYFYQGNPKLYLVDSLEKFYQQQFAIRSGDQKALSASVSYGAAVAKEIITWSENDHIKSLDLYKPKGTDGYWEQTPPGYATAAEPFWGRNKELVIGCKDVQIARIPAYSTDPNSDFYRMVKDLYDVSRSLTEEQKRIALFWDDSPNGKYASVFGHWSSILAQIMDEKKIPLNKAAEAFATLHIVMHDAAIVAWQGKYKFEVPRPITYIQHYIDKQWQPLIETPPHPEFPAAHATFSSAAATALTHVLGDSLEFTDASYRAFGLQPRKFHSLMEASREAGLSRLYGGIHYRNSIEESFRIGRLVAENSLGKLHLCENPNKRMQQ